MTVYADASAILRLYADEADSAAAGALLDTTWASARHTEIEVRRNLVRVLVRTELESARRRFFRDWHATDVIELTEEVCVRAAELAERTGARTLDALHLGAAEAAGAGELPIVTFDRRLAEAARSLGWDVRGA